MPDIITAKEFIENTFNTNFLSDEEKETIVKAMELYARGIAANYGHHIKNTYIGIEIEGLELEEFTRYDNWLTKNTKQ